MSPRAVLFFLESLGSAQASLEFAVEICYPVPDTASCVCVAIHQQQEAFPSPVNESYWQHQDPALCVVGHRISVASFSK